MPAIRVDRREDIPRVIAIMEVAGSGHRVPVLRAVNRNEISHMELQRDTSSRQMKLWAAAARSPALALIGDDNPGVPSGPDAWPVAARMFRWTKGILIHGGAGHPSHYEMAIEMTRAFDRLLMIECSSNDIGAWEAAAKTTAPRVRGLILRPSAGTSHPDLSLRVVQ